MLRFFQLLLLLVLPMLAASGEEIILEPPPGGLNAILRNTAMPELSGSRIATILNRYYKEGLGGSESWSKIESLHVVGDLKTKGGQLELTGYQKKPDLIKLTLEHNSARSEMTLSYDGKVAWKQEGRRANPTPMTEKEARRFIHSARFGNYLLYPYADGKRIRLVDTVPVEGKISHHIRVELDTGYQVDYFIDIREYLEIKVENTDLSSGLKNSIIYDDYERVSGMPVARKVESRENGEWVSSLVLSEVKVNSGVMPWMFHMPQ